MKRWLILGVILATVAVSLNAQTQVRLRLVPSEGGGGGAFSELTATDAERYTYYCDGGYSGSGTVRMTDGSSSDVVTKITAASDGDIVCIPAGSFVWTDIIGVENKDIFILGAGRDVTTIDHDTGNMLFSMAMSQAGKGDWRLSGFTITGTQPGVPFLIASPSYNGVLDSRWRVDHVKMDYDVGGTNIFQISGINYGLIDHITGEIHAANFILLSQFVDADALTAFPVYGDLVGTQPLDLGTDKFVVMEDSTLTFVWDAGNSVWFDSSAGGGRVTLRYNTVTGALIYNHWTRGAEYAAHVMEIYSNTMTGTDADGDDIGWDSYVGQIEAGTGVFYNNRVNGYDENAPSDPYIWFTERRGGGSETNAPLNDCDGSEDWDGNIEASGWPCLGQIGRAPGKSLATIIGGDKQASYSFKLWNNGPEADCLTGGGGCTDTVTVYNNGQNTIIQGTVEGTTHSNGDQDYELLGSTPPMGYTPLAYPHHLQATAWP